ncbi:MAG: hypothetical protein AB9919_06805 [Geobacteraceae bacterium]
MEIIWSIKEKNGATWEMIQLSTLAGKTLQQFFEEAAGKEIVAEFIIGGKQCYFCGTTHWLERMKQKGSARTFDQAATLIQDRNPKLLQEVFPGLADIAETFPGTVVESFTAFQPTEQPEQAGLFA